jgi:glycosyltransferase involved in cell wall biosynthesis
MQMTAADDDLDRAGPLLSVVIPCFNESGGIEELYRRIHETCLRTVPDSYEIVFINDGSTDDTRDQLANLANIDKRVVVVDLARNYGHQIALSAGLELCRGLRIFILDADLQDPPELLAGMIAKMDEGYDVVYGERTEREGENWFKLFTASIFYRFLSKLADIKIAQNVGDFRLMSRRALDHLNAMPERSRYIRGMVSWIGLKQVAFPYKRERRFVGSTHYPLRKMILLALDALTSFSVVPLRFASYLGICFGAFGIFALVYTLIGWLMGATLPGWTSIVSIALILGSIQLMMLGIIGEYIGRMYIEAKRRPLYIVNEVISNRVAEPGNEAVNFHLFQLQRSLKKMRNV